MSNEFDFRIKQSVYVQALDTYKKAEKKLAEEREAQKSNMSYMRNNISGSTSDALEIATGSFFSPYGAYDKAWAQVKCMRDMLEDTLPEINALMARCEEFPEQLQSDNYIEPIRPAEGNNTSRNGDILSLNYDKVAVIKDTCDQIAELGQEIGSELESIMQSCSGVLSGVNHDMEEARAATRKIKRVLSFKDSFQKYEAGIKALEFDMLIGFSRLGMQEEESWLFADSGKMESAFWERIEQLSLTDDTWNYLKELGLEREQIKDLYLTLKSDDEREVYLSLISGDYENAFLTSPNFFSNEAKYAITDYANRIFYGENGTEKFSSFVNCMILTNEERCNTLGNNYGQQYVRMLSEMSGAIADVQSALLWEKNLPTVELLQEEKQRGQQIYEMYGLWDMLDKAMDSQYFMELDGYHYKFGGCTYQISEVVRTDLDNVYSPLEFDLSVMRKTEEGYVVTVGRRGIVSEDGKNDIEICEQTKAIQVSVNWDLYSMISDEMLKQYRELHQQESLKDAEAVYSVAIMGLAMADPFLGTMVTLESGVLQQKTSDKVAGLESISKLYGKTDLSKVLGLVKTVQKGNEGKESVSKSIEKLDQQAMGWIMGSSISGNIGGDAYVIDCGVYDPNIVQNLKKWEENGLAGLKNRYDMDRIDEIASKIGYKEHGDKYQGMFTDMRQKAMVTEYLDVLLYGAETTGSELSIMEMDMEALTKCISMIDDAGEISCIELIREQQGSDAE